MVQSFDLCTIHVSKTILDALGAIERGEVGIALIVDDRGVLVGTVTDGDIRRALLGGESLQSPLSGHMQRQFSWVGPGVRRADVLDLMRARMIEQIPIVDSEMRLIGLHRIHEILGTIERPNCAVIMAGGRGTRLNPITEHLPKPMIPVAGKPILERLVLHLVGFGIRRIFLSLNYMGEVIENHFGDGSRFGCRIEYLKEDRPLGTGGALSLLPQTPADPLLVMNGDLVTQADIGALLEHHAHGGGVATVAVHRYAHTVPFGCVEVDGDRIVRLEEKPQIQRLVNAGIYVISPGLLGGVPKHQDFPITTLLQQSLARKERVLAFEIIADWIDVGLHEQLRDARQGKGGDGS